MINLFAKSSFLFKPIYKLLFLPFHFLPNMLNKRCFLIGRMFVIAVNYIRLTFVYAPVLQCLAVEVVQLLQEDASVEFLQLLVDDVA